MSIESVLRQLESEINEARLVNPRCVISRIRQAVESADTLHSRELMQKDLELSKLRDDLTSAQNNAMADARARDFADATGWISVDERLPEQFAEVILDCKKGRIIGYYDGSRWRDTEWDSEVYLCAHWMPMPEPPKEPSNER